MQIMRAIESKAAQSNPVVGKLLVNTCQLIHFNMLSSTSATSHLACQYEASGFMETDAAVRRYCATLSDALRLGDVVSC